LGVVGEGGSFQAGQAENSGESEGESGGGDDDNLHQPDRDRQLTFKEIMGDIGDPDRTEKRAARIAYRGIPNWFDQGAYRQNRHFGRVKRQIEEGVPPQDIEYEFEGEVFNSFGQGEDAEPHLRPAGEPDPPEDTGPDQETTPAGAPIDQILGLLREQVFETEPEEPGTSRQVEPRIDDHKKADRLGITPKRAMYLRWLAEQEYEAGHFDLDQTYSGQGPDPWSIRVYRLGFPDVDLTIYQKQEISRKVGQSTPCVPSEWAKTVLHGLEKDWAPFHPENFVDSYLDRIGVRNNAKTPDPSEERMSYMRILEGNGIDLSERDPYTWGDDPRESVLAEGHAESEQPERTAPRLSPLVENDIEDVQQGERKRQSPPFSGDEMRPVEDQPNGEGERWSQLRIENGNGIDLSEKGWGERDPKHRGDE
jgi:hypothetical protein